MQILGAGQGGIWYRRSYETEPSLVGSVWGTGVYRGETVWGCKPPYTFVQILGTDPVWKEDMQVETRSVAGQTLNP